MTDGTAYKVFSAEWWAQLGDTIAQWLSTSGLKLLLGLVVLFILFKLINLFAKGIRKTMIKKGVEKTIYTVTYATIRKVLKFLLLLLLLGFVGIETAGIGSIIASAGVAIGLALQGSLSNLAGGLIILVTKPFRIGDYVEAQSLSGTVEDIHVFYTVLVTPDNKIISMPNGALSNGNIINYSQKKYRRVDFRFTVSYDEDFTKAKEAILDVALAIPEVMSAKQGAPADPFIKVIEQKENALELVTRVWSKAEDYWTVFFSMQEQVKAKFDAERIAIPYPQLDVHYDRTQPVLKPSALVDKDADGTTQVLRTARAQADEDRKNRIILSAEEQREAAIKALKAEDPEKFPFRFPTVKNKAARSRKPKEDNGKTTGGTNKRDTKRKGEDKTESE